MMNTNTELSKVNACCKDALEKIAKPQSYTDLTPQIDCKLIAIKTLEAIADGVSCGHKGCLHHSNHPCETCGRINGIKLNHEDNI